MGERSSTGAATRIVNMSNATLKPLVIKVPIEVDAHLVLLLPDGTRRIPSKEELLSLRLRHESDMYARTRELLDQVFGSGGAEDLPEKHLLRYFIEHITHYAHDLEPEELDRMRRLVGPPVDSITPTAADSQLRGPGLSQESEAPSLGKENQANGKTQLQS